MAKQILGKKFLSDLKLYTDYFKWREELGRYENWSEACEDIVNGHRIKYNEHFIEPELELALKQMQEMRVFASQRNLQFRGPQINRSNLRLYNCSVIHAVKNTVFQEAFYLSLNGCGVGVSLLKPFVNNISKVCSRSNNTLTHVIEDSIEGWANAIGVLMSSYFIDDHPFPEYANHKIKFDYSLIRPEGSLISGGFKAPGSKGLQYSLEKIEILLDNITKNGITRLKPIHVYDIICHCANAVLSGGVRRCLAEGSNVLTLNETYKPIEKIVVGDLVKTMNGYKKVTNTFKQGIQDTIKIHHQFGELVCTKNHKVAIVKNGKIEWVTAEELTTNENLVFCLDEYSEQKCAKMPEFIYNKPFNSTTCKDITIPKLDEDIAYLIGLIQGDGYVRLTSKSGSIDIAIEHDRPEKVENVINILKRFNVNPTILYPKEYDNCYKVRVKSKQLALYFYTHIKQPKTELSVPKFILEAGADIQKAYVSGVFCSDGSFKTRPAQVCVSIYKNFLKELQIILCRFGIHSMIKDITCNRNKKWNKIYSLNVLGLDNFNKFKKLVEKSPKSNDKGLIQKANFTSIEKSFNNIQPVKIIEIEKYKYVETYDIEVEDEHSFICESVLVHNSALNMIVDPNDEEMIYAKIGSWRQENPQRARSNNSVLLIRNSVEKEEFKKLVKLNNGDSDIGFAFGNSWFDMFNPCFEISFTPVNTSEDVTQINYENLENWSAKNKDNFGVQLCNLTSINAEKITSKETFLDACEAASILGTLQAGYTYFPYLSKASEIITKKEALLGVSITGWMNNPKLFNEEWLKEGAKKIVETNKLLASKLEINQAARTTCVKPEGNLSVIAQTASGIHPEHSERYFRVMQINKISDTAKWLIENVPFLLEESVWSQNNTDYVVFIPVINPKDGLFKESMKGVKHLELIKLVQENWVLPGTNTHLGISKKINHNVSNTVIVDNQDEIIDYIWNNKESFTAVSFISDYGDKDFNQAPFTSVLSFEEITEKYGKGALFASGLIVDGLHYFNNNLWQACDSLVDNTTPIIGTREQTLLRKDWLRRAKQFAKNYFKGDIKTMVYCLKDIHLYHKFETINRQMKEVDFATILKKPTYKDVADYAAQSCSGGQCEIVRI